MATIEQLITGKLTTDFGGYRVSTAELENLIRELATEKGLPQSALHNMVTNILATPLKFASSFDQATDWDKAKVARGSLRRGLHSLNISKLQEKLKAFEGKLVKAQVKAIVEHPGKAGAAGNSKRVELEIVDPAFTDSFGGEGEALIARRVIMPVHSFDSAASGHHAEAGTSVGSEPTPYQIGQELEVVLTRLVISSNPSKNKKRAETPLVRQSSSQATFQLPPVEVEVEKEVVVSNSPLPTATTRPTTPVSNLALQQKLIEDELAQETQAHQAMALAAASTSVSTAQIGSSSSSQLPMHRWYWLASVTSRDYVIRLFEKYLPQLEVKAVARQAGRMCKIALAPILASVTQYRREGEEQKGQEPLPLHLNFKNYEEQLKVIQAALPASEQLQVVNYIANPRKLIARALAPAVIPFQAVRMLAGTSEDADKPQVVIAVSSELIGRAIGRGGINVKLAAELTGYFIKLEVAHLATAKPGHSFKFKKQAA